MKTPCPLWHVPSYRRFSRLWWSDLGWYVVRGFWRDLYWFYHRGRYGWAPRDIWSLDAYVDKVMGETLWALAENAHGAPAGYPHIGPDNWQYAKDDPYTPLTDFDQWQADLRRWSKAFSDNARDDYYNLHGKNYDAWIADEDARLKARNAALAEMLPWWSALWD